MKFIAWFRRDVVGAIIVILLTLWFVLSVLVTLATPGDPFDESPNREPVQYPHQ